MSVLIGTSGWQYADWKPLLYPDVPQRLWLERHAEVFATVEVNNAFYRLPKREVFEAWADRTPDDYVMTVNEPASLVKPFVWNAYFVWNPGEAINPYEYTLEEWASIKNTLRK